MICHFTSTLNMSYSHTHNAVHSAGMLLWNAFHRWEGNASLHESHTLMEEFISTCSSVSDGSFAVERLMFSMWTVGTQILSLLAEHRKRVTTMQLRAETLSVEDYDEGTVSAEVEMGRLAISGLRLRVRRIENSFGNFVTNWIPRVLQQLSLNLEHTRTGNSLWPIQSMNLPLGILSGLDSLTDEMIGYYNLVSDLRNHE